MRDERGAAHAECVALGVVVACLAYGASLALQLRVPAVKEFLSLDLGTVRPTYYLRVGVSLTAGLLAASLAALGRRRATRASEDALAWAAATLIGVAVLLAVSFP